MSIYNILSDVMGFALGSLIYRYWRLRKTYKSTVKTSSRLIATLHAQLRELNNNYSALEIGIDEQAESYEMQFLTFKEDLEARANLIESMEAEIEILQGIVSHHDDHCLGSNLQMLQ